jgi:hypothetical protein
MSIAYNPTGRFEIKAWDVEFRRAPKRMLMARVYQPQGPGPFPTLLDAHGGAWHNKDRFANVPMCEAAARSGVLVVAIDMTNSPEAPYPASVQDANYGVRWLKSRAPEWKGDPSTLGILGSSSGGHVAELIGMRPRDPRYNALPGPAGVDATVAYVATRSPISDPYARCQHMEKTNRPDMVKKSRLYFDPWDLHIRGQSAADPRSRRKDRAAAASDHAGRARFQRAVATAGKIRKGLPRGRRRVRARDFQGLRAHVDRPARAADRSRARGADGIHRSADAGAAACRMTG